jgi:hypothetical protein
VIQAKDYSPLTAREYQKPGAEKTEGKSCILQQCDLFENNVSQNNHLFVFAYSHQCGRHYRWLDAYQHFELGIQQAAMVHNCAVYVQQGSILVFFNKATYLRIM